MNTTSIDQNNTLAKKDRCNNMYLVHLKAIHNNFTINTENT